MLLIGTDSNDGESSQMLLKKTLIKTSCHIHQRGWEGEFECVSVHLRFYNLFPNKNSIK